MLCDGIMVDVFHNIAFQNVVVFCPYDSACTMLPGGFCFQLWMCSGMLVILAMKHNYAKGAGLCCSILEHKRPIEISVVEPFLKTC